MLRSIRAEWYKAVRRPYFPILFLTCTLLTVGVRWKPLLPSSREAPRPLQIN